MLELQQRLDYLIRNMLTIAHDTFSHLKHYDIIVKQIQDLSDGGSPDNPNLFTRSDIPTYKKIRIFFDLFRKFEFIDLFEKFESETAIIFRDLHKYIMTNLNNEIYRIIKSGHLSYHPKYFKRPHFISRKYAGMDVKVIDLGPDRFAVQSFDTCEIIYDSKTGVVSPPFDPISTVVGRKNRKNTRIINYNSSPVYLPKSVPVGADVYVKVINKTDFSVHEVAIDKKTGKETAGKLIKEFIKSKIKVTRPYIREVQIVPGRSPHRQINYKGVRRSVPLSHPVGKKLFVNVIDDNNNYSIHEISIDKKTGEEKAGILIKEFQKSNICIVRGYSHRKDVRVVTYKKTSVFLPSSIPVNTRVFVKDTDKKNFSIHEVAIDKKTRKEIAGKRIDELKRISKL